MNGFRVNCILRILLGLQMWVAIRGWKKCIMRNFMI